MRNKSLSWILMFVMMISVIAGMSLLTSAAETASPLGGDDVTVNSAENGAPFSLKASTKTFEYMDPDGISDDNDPVTAADSDSFLASTNDTSDRSDEISAMLKKTGCCMLGSGEFFIKGVSMPYGSSIRGQGNATRVYWIDDDSPDYIFKLGSRCSLSDMWISQYPKSGSDSSGEVLSEVRDFSAVEFSGSFTKETPVSGPYASTLSNLIISDIQGSGIRLSRTGTAMTAHIAALNCHILRCDCGLHCDVMSEFHQFTNITCSGCYYGLICRGGNNTFDNCNFSGNYTGIYLDNVTGESYNNGHGIFNACVIDHSKPDNNGTALLCDGITVGMKFVGCTFGYGNILIKNTVGIRFYDCGMGHIDISIQHSKGTVFSNLGLKNKSDFSVTETDSENTRMINCFYLDGSEFTQKDVTAAYLIQTEVEGSGTATDTLTVSTGQYATLTATPDESEFVGWFEGETLVCAEPVYRFIPTKSITLTAKFTKPVYLLGDVDHDGSVTVLDALAIQKKLGNIPISIEWMDEIADTDGDSKVSVIDATYIQKWLAKIPSNDNIGKPIAS